MKDQRSESGVTGSAANRPVSPQDPGGGTEPEAEILLQLTDVYHSYRARGANFEHGEHTVLDGVSLAVRRGETVGIVGRNGAGKTTLLRLMGGILAPNRGEIRRAPGIRCSLLSLGLGFKNDLSGRDNARLSALLQGASPAAADACLETIRDFAGLGASFDEPVKTYSSGMRARLGFATALQTRVDLLLIDEILSVGDRDFRERAAQAMKDRLSGAQTVILVSHAEHQVRDLCDRAIWIEGGKVHSEGSTDEVLRHYKGAA